MLIVLIHGGGAVVIPGALLHGDLVAIRIRRVDVLAKEHAADELQVPHQHAVFIVGQDMAGVIEDDAVCLKTGVMQQIAVFVIIVHVAGAIAVIPDLAAADGAKAHIIQRVFRGVDGLAAFIQLPVGVQVPLPFKDGSRQVSTGVYRSFSKRRAAGEKQGNHQNPDEALLHRKRS